MNKLLYISFLCLNSCCLVEETVIVYDSKKNLFKEVFKSNINEGDIEYDFTNTGMVEYTNKEIVEQINVRDSQSRGKAKVK